MVVEGPTAVRGFALAADGRIAVQIGDEARMIAPDGTSRTLGKGGTWCVANAEFDKVGDRLIIDRCDRSMAILVGSDVIELAGSYAKNRIGVSRDGTLIAGAMADRTVRIWDANTGKQLHVLRGHTDLVMDVAFSPDGTQLASSSYDKTIRIWQLGTQRARVLRGHSGAVDRVLWRDGSHLVTGGRDATLRIWDVPSMDLPTAAELAGRLSGATSARIDLDRPTTTDATGGAS
jgi:WD40 repeat protein